MKNVEKGEGSRDPALQKAIDESARALIEQREKAQQEKEMGEAIFQSMIELSKKEKEKEKAPSQEEEAVLKAKAISLKLLQRERAKKETEEREADEEEAILRSVKEESKKLAAEELLKKQIDAALEASAEEIKLQSTVKVTSISSEQRRSAREERVERAPKPKTSAKKVSFAKEMLDPAPRSKVYMTQLEYDLNNLKKQVDEGEKRVMTLSKGTMEQAARELGQVAARHYGTVPILFGWSGGAPQAQATRARKGETARGGAQERVLRGGTKQGAASARHAPHGRSYHE